jgi:hypothetical protein
MRARLSRCSRAIEERVLRSQSACSSHRFLAPSGTRLFLHFAQRTPVATTLCSCMIVGESGSLKHVKRKTPVSKHHRVLLTTDIAPSLAALHTLSPMPPITAPVAKPIYHQDSNGLCAELAILDKTTFPARELHVPLSSIGEFSCCGLTRSPFTSVFVPQNARPRVKPALICFSRNPWTAIYMDWPGLLYSSPNRYASLPQPIDGNTQRVPKAAAPDYEPPMSRSMNMSGHPRRQLLPAGRHSGVSLLQDPRVTTPARTGLLISVATHYTSLLATHRPYGCTAVSKRGDPCLSSRIIFKARLNRDNVCPLH